MSRIPTPTTVDAAPAASRPLLEAIKKQLSVVPNVFRLVANSPAALEGYLGLSGALNKGTLPAATRERIALAVAAIKTAARPTPRRPPRFASPSRSRERGHVSDDDVRAVRSAGYDAQVIEIVLHVALNTWTNYINVIAKTDIDFPVVTARKAA